ncbi:MAG: GNAT family N-acetyltransferase [Alphaproteobacteria bacterium 13_2_20CM_2_64_7]|nr:MAG: GNAT family N-acetyltransferase [Alphaproteobacteria bacterium 13_2_20CM_2_64_7]
MHIRAAEARDERRWRELFDGYCRFYERQPDDALMAYTWHRIMDPSVPVHAIVAEKDGGGVIGIANYLLHEHTLGLTPACYLGDLFVDPKERAAGVGQQLIDWLVAEMKAQGWCRLYWHTRNTNYRARGLYDKFTPHSDFVRYTVYPK